MDLFQGSLVVCSSSECKRSFFLGGERTHEHHYN
jgi:hypothetical protein